MTDPAQPAPQLERGKVYESLGPNGEKIVIMTPETWEDMGTGMASVRQALSNQSRLLQESKAENKILLTRLSNVTDRLENLRAVRRAEKRPEVEAALNNLSDNPYTQG